MKSPFPGMDPFIERCGLWGDFHHSLVCEVAGALGDAVPRRYLIRIAERRYYVPVESPEEEYCEPFVKIQECGREQSVVTIIDMPSPSNKQPHTLGWDLYQRQRRSILTGNVNLVEIDLLRGGERMPMLDRWPDSPYVLLVAAAKNRPNCHVWPADFQRPLPQIPVPLAKPDADILLDLQPLIEEIYRTFRYEQSIDYGESLVPPLKPEEAAWLKERLRRFGRS
jgi:hypothetical protein